MGPGQPQHDFQSTGTGNGESQPSAQPGATLQGSATAHATPRPRTSLAKPDGAVALHACTKCRKKRVKCDGQRPCARCQTDDASECRDDIALRRSKEGLRTELQSLRERQDSIDQVLSAVADPRLSAQVLGRLRAGQSLDAILRWVKEVNGSSGASSGSALLALSKHADYEANYGPGNDLVQSETGFFDSGNCISRPLAATDHPGYTPGPETMPQFPGLEHILWPRGPPTTAPSPEVWTDITNDIILIRHLLALYFCWEYPLFSSLSREHFMKDFYQGQYRYCSPLLVNSLLALGSRWSTLPNSRANPNDSNLSGDRFFAESVRLLNQETDHRSLTTVQALGVMSMRQISCGRDAEGRYYSAQAIRLAIDMGLHRKVNGVDEELFYVQASTFWGAFSLDTVLSAAVGSLPQFPHLSPLPPKPVFLDDVEVLPWIPYTGDGMLFRRIGSPRQRPNAQTSNIASAYNCFCQFSEMIHGTLYALYSPVSQLTGEILLGKYTSYLNWYDQMPEALRLGLNSTPAVLFSHMTYHFAIIQLFRPFLGLQVFESNISPGRICHQAADAIQGLLRSYSLLYTLHRTPALVPCLALASAVSHLDKHIIDTPAPPIDSDTDMPTVGSVDQHSSNALDQDISDLREMAACHYSATQAINLIGSLAKALKVEVDINEATFSAQPYGLASHTSSTEDHDRLARPYMRRNRLEAHRVEDNGFLLDEQRGVGFMLSTQPPD